MQAAACTVSMCCLCVSSVGMRSPATQGLNDDHAVHPVFAPGRVSKALLSVKFSKREVFSVRFDIYAPSAVILSPLAECCGLCAILTAVSCYSSQQNVTVCSNSAALCYWSLVGIIGVADVVFARFEP